jgi:hypothetical protein
LFDILLKNERGINNFSDFKNRENSFTVDIYYENWWKHVFPSEGLW